MIIGILYQTYTIGYPPVLSLIMASTFSIYTALKKITSYSAWESLFLESLSIVIHALFLFKIYYPAQPQPINTWIILFMVGFVTGLPLYLFSLSCKKYTNINIRMSAIYMPYIRNDIRHFNIQRRITY